MGDDLRVLAEHGREGGGLHARTSIELVSNERLRRLLFAGKRQPDVAFDYRQRGQLALVGPPVRSAVEYLLLRRRVDDLPRTGGDRPLLCRVEMLERRPILSFKDVLWDDVHADVIFVGHKEEK